MLRGQSQDERNGQRKGGNGTPYNRPPSTLLEHADVKERREPSAWGTSPPFASSTQPGQQAGIRKPRTSILPRARVERPLPNPPTLRGRPEPPTIQGAVPQKGNPRSISGREALHKAHAARSASDDAVQSSPMGRRQHPLGISDAQVQKTAGAAPGEEDGKSRTTEREREPRADRPANPGLIQTILGLVPRPNPRRPRGRKNAKNQERTAAAMLPPPPSKEKTQLAESSATCKFPLVAINASITIGYDRSMRDRPEEGGGSKP